MGEKVTGKKIAFISFEPLDGKFRGFLSIEAAFSAQIKAEIIIERAVKLYEKNLDRMRLVVNKIKSSREARIPVAARLIWTLGNMIFEFKSELEELGLEIDGIYDHFARDLKVKRKWLEKVIIFRRYIPSINLVHKSLNWGLFEKGTRQKAKALSSKRETL